MSYSLLIIDMQNFFHASRDTNVINNCKHEIIKAIKAKAAIIFVEYNSYGQTIPALTRLTRSYKRTFFVKKNNDDGSNEVINLIQDKDLPANRIKVCGVNTDCCVSQTVYGVHRKMNPSRMRVIGRACNSTYDHSYGLFHMAKICKVDNSL